jgi:hypothetical protein
VLARSGARPLNEVESVDLRAFEDLVDLPN